MPLPSPDPSVVVPLLVAAAGLDIPPADLAKLVAAYPSTRANADALYAVPGLADVSPVLTFSPVV